MGFRLNAALAVALMLTLGPGPGFAQRAPVPAPPQFPPDRRVVRFDLQRFNELRTLSPADCARKGIAFLREEIGRPSDPGRGMHAYEVIDHGYTLATMTTILANHQPDLQVLRAELRKSPPGELRDALILTLGQCGEREVLPAAAELFADPGRHPALRTRVASVLERMPDERVVPYALRVLLTDTVTFIEPRKHATTLAYIGLVRAYRVRRHAVSVLRALERAGIPLDAPTREAMTRVVLEVPLPKE